MICFNITSRTNPKVAEAASLSEKKFRDRLGLFRFDGIKLFREAAACRVGIRYVFVREDCAASILPTVEKLRPDTQVFILSAPAFDRVSDEKSPEGIITVADKMTVHDALSKDGHVSPHALSGPEAGRIIALESVRDPGNVGTVVRAAAAFGIDTVLMSSDCADIFNPKTVRAAMGAIFSRRIIRVPDMEEAVLALKAAGRRTFATALLPDALRLGEFEIAPLDVFVIGNEGHGLSEATIGRCDSPVFIPMMTGPGIESLNAATAASVIMYEQAKCLR